MRNFIYITMMAALMVGAIGLRAEKDNSSAAFADFKLPQYDEKGKLMFILYGKTGHAVGINVSLDNVMLDLIKSSVRDIDTVTDLSNAKPYPIMAPLSEVIKFWSNKLHCDALIWSESAVFDRSTNIVRGTDKVQFRSPYLDIDAVGFDAESATKTVHLRKKVKVVIRMDLVNRTPSTSSKSTVKEKKP